MENTQTFSHCLRCWALFLILLWGSIGVKALNSEPVKVVRDLIERVTPGYSSQFRLEIQSSSSGDFYTVEGEKGSVVLRGNNAISLSVAYHQYLKQVCKVHLSWCGDRISLPSLLPAPTKPINGPINGKYRVYMNYCTVSYSAVWWGWKRWQRELDFMAMNGINTPLFTVGLEAVWYNTLLRFHFTDLEARTFLTGPGHSAWQWMQNIQSYGGPLPKSWIDSHIVLGRQILNRMLEFGMQPIQQGFSGYVPRELKQKYPEASIRLQGHWCGFPGAGQLDPTDPLFLTFGKVFLEEEKKLFGAHGLYAADPFHESAPPVDTPEYMHAVGMNIYRVFKEHDPKAKWAMQSWSLREPIVKAVPKEDLVILDLNGGRCNKKGAVWGYPIVDGNLHNFGSRINLHGDLRLLASNQYVQDRRLSPNVCGSGLFMEGIFQNPVYYDLAFEMPVHSGSINIEAWLADYAERRYGVRSPKSEAAWKLLLEGPYRPGTNGTECSSIIAARPALNVKKSGPNAGFSIPYAPVTLWEAEKLLLESTQSIITSSGYRFDLVDVLRQALSNLGQEIHRKAANAFYAKDKSAFDLHSQRFLQLLRDVDDLLRTRPEYSFDKWIHDARSHGTTENEKNLYERDATALLTIWGPEEPNEIRIFDYSWREWSGLIEGYYLVRWEYFYKCMAEYLATGKEYKEEGLPLVHGRETFRANEVYDGMADIELAFVNRTNKVRYPIIKGDEIRIVRKLFHKYLPMLNEYYKDLQKEGPVFKGERNENFGEAR